MAKTGYPEIFVVPDGIVWDFSNCAKVFAMDRSFVEHDWHGIQDSSPEELSIVYLDEEKNQYIVQRLNKKLGTKLLMDAQKK